MVTEKSIIRVEQRVKSNYFGDNHKQKRTRVVVFNLKNFHSQ